MSSQTKLLLSELSDPHGSEVFYRIGVARHADHDGGATDEAAGGLESIRHALARSHGQHQQPYRHTVLAERDFGDETDAFTLERDLRDVVAIAHYRPLRPFSGETGCFACERGIVDMIARYIEEI